MTISALDDWEDVIAERAAERSARRRRGRFATALVGLAVAAAAVAVIAGTDRPANAAHAAVVEAPPLRFVAELRGSRGPSDRAVGAVDFSQGYGVIESRRTNHLGTGWEVATFPTLGWEDDRAIYLRGGEVRSWAFEDENLVFFLEHVLAATPDLLAEAERVDDGRDDDGNGRVVARVPAAVAERLVIASMPVTVDLEMRGVRIEAMSMRWESRYRPGVSVSVAVDFGAEATPTDLDRSIFASARPTDPGEG